MKMTTLKKSIVLGLLLSFAACSGAIAGQTWLCSVADAVAVDEDGTVGQPDLGGLETPTFLRVDADKKVITLLAPESRRGEVTQINSVYEGKEMWVFTGVEEGRAWSLVISNKGTMTLSVTSDGATWSVFGQVLPENAASDKD